MTIFKLVKKLGSSVIGATLSVLSSHIIVTLLDNEAIFPSLQNFPLFGVDLEVMWFLFIMFVYMYIFTFEMESYVAQAAVHLVGSKGAI